MARPSQNQRRRRADTLGLIQSLARGIVGHEPPGVLHGIDKRAFHHQLGIGTEHVLPLEALDDLGARGPPLSSSNSCSPAGVGTVWRCS
jgi:hypothetical protein